MIKDESGLQCYMASDSAVLEGNILGDIKQSIFLQDIGTRALVIKILHF